MTMIAKLRRYADEIGLCRRLGAGFSDRMLLASDTILFHALNARGRLDCADDETVRRCRIQLPQRPQGPVDFHYRRRGGDLFILHEVFLDQCYQIPPLLAGRVTSVVDLGANIGLATLALHSQFPGASFVCVEPNPRNAEVLRANVAWLGSQVRVVQSAVSDYDGEAEFQTDGASWEGSLGSGTGSMKVPCCRLDTLLDTLNVDRVDVLKVDIEGAERGVFATRGDWWRKIGVIVAELHNGYTFADFRTDMSALGFLAIEQGSKQGNVMHMAVRA